MPPRLAHRNPVRQTSAAELGRPHLLAATMAPTAATLRTVTTLRMAVVETTVPTDFLPPLRSPSVRLHLCHPATQRARIPSAQAQPTSATAKLLPRVGLRLV